ncbi:methyltransferase domain-containing protein [Scytonema sp. UIC 10036]|uniref:class I SAM-dependent methyltransferase n=1 Tax=Scytonema sp. UIC 10036 TaxID=2304196 RepID=UPI0012DAB928|nr:class I SAM-dependent methyltransferase [Scytonema sp. UIC 10036]MUG92074.1 methyltransferase domain-containing protein [Scytonema sp. UIC 10036]
MNALPMYDPTLFKGTAKYYARYRPQYPNSLFKLLSEAFHLNGQGRLLDLGCGTGEIAIPLSDCFEEVVALDPQPEMLREARREAETVGASNITWVEQRAEQISPSLGFFRLITIGKALHWMDEELVLQRCHDLLLDDGGVAIISTSRNFWKNPDELWKQKIIEVVKKWLGDRRRAGSTTKSFYTTSTISKNRLLARIPFARTQKCRFKFKQKWTLKTILGYLYSTSFCSQSLLGDRVLQFEADLKKKLLEVEPSGKFKEKIPLTVHLAWKQLS